MKKYILDKESLLKNPNIISEWNPNYHFVVPDLIVKEASIQNDRISNLQNLRNFTDRLLRKGFVEIPKIDTSIHDFSKEVEKGTGLSYTQFHLAHYAKDNSNSKDTTYLVSNDKILISYCEGLGVETINYLVLKVLLRNYKKVKEENVSNDSNIRSHQLKFILLSILLGLVLTGFSLIIYLSRNWLIENLPFWIIIFILLLIPVMFYWVRSNYRITYSVAEFFFGFYSSYSVIKPYVGDINLTQLYYSVPFLLGGIYIMVRGLDNLNKGIKDTIIEPFWNKIFNESTNASR